MEKYLKCLPCLGVLLPLENVYKPENEEEVASERK
jgi:hypothetical protein